MQKTVKFLKHYPKRGWNDNFICGFRFSVIDTHLIGTPYEVETKHKLQVTITDRLMSVWNIPGALEIEEVTDEMIKVAYQSAEEYISKLIQSGAVLESELSPLERTTENSPESCPYKTINITYPTKDTFVVDFDKVSSALADDDKAENAQLKPLKVFLCHATADKPAVRVLYKQLVNDGVDAWLDQEKILPGQDWRAEIPKAVRNSDVVVVCLSKNSVNKEGYVQKEIKDALDIADEKPEGTIFIIPARLEQCDVPDRLSKYQWVDLFVDEGYDRLSRALNTRLHQIDEKRIQAESKLISFPPNKHNYHSSMKDGPKLYDDKAVYFGAYKIVKFSEKERGKSLRISVSATSDKSSLWIELWRGAIEGEDYKIWTNKRGRVVRSSRHEKPSLTWPIEDGEYTIYFVTEGEYITEYHVPSEKINYFDISYTVEIL